MDKVYFGLYVSMYDCVVIELAAAAGFDFVRIDLEHTLLDNMAVANLIRTANLLQLPVQVRVSSLHEITRLLDFGADGIVVPDITDPARARQAVEACKYAPLGKRGMFPPGRANRYGLENFAKFHASGNKRTVLIVQIEDQEAISNIDAILALEGIDMVATGRADLSQSLGVPGKISDKLVIEAENAIIQKALVYNKQPAIMTSTHQRVQQLITMGVRHIITGPDTSMFYNGLKNWLCSLKQ